MTAMRPAPDGLATLLFGTYRLEVLRLLLPNPDRTLHVREIARATGKLPGTVLRELNQLADAGILLRRRVGNQVQFQADVACPIHAELRSILRKAPPKRRHPKEAAPRAGHALQSPAAEYAVRPAKFRVPLGKLAALCRRYDVHRLSLFGSAARNALKADSDIDLLVEFAPDSRASLFDLSAMQDELSPLFGGRKVDLATPEILENPFRRKTIVPDLTTLYAA
jgi:predicted nucleotidyltransferase/DNA-binding transcriptional ArsR family regulator